MTTGARMHALSPPNCGWNRIPILPIRYAVVPRDTESGSTRYADSGYDLDTEFPALKRSVYTLRALRPGYVYVFMKGPEGERLVIHEHDGEGHFKELRYQGLECYHRRDCFVSNRSLGWVWVEQDQAVAAEIWIGYSSHLWTNAMTARLCASQAMRSRHMRRLDLVELLSGESSPSTQPHVLPASALVQWVEDYKPAGRRMPLFWSCHESSPDLTPYTFLSLRAHYPCLTPRVPAVVVLNDAEGICLDLGLSVSAYQHQVRDLMPTPVHMRFDDPSQSTHDAVPSCFYKTSGVLSANSQDYHRKNAVALLIEQTLESISRHKSTTAGLIESERHRAVKRREPRHRHDYSPSQQRYIRLTDPRLSPQGARLAKRLDVDKYMEFLGQRDQMQAKIEQLQALASEAACDHDLWLASAESASLEDNRSLAAALATYDRENLASAVGLEITLALLLHPMSQSLPGMEDEDPRFRRLESWLDQEDSPLFVALAPFNPFKERADAVATLLGAHANILNDLGGRFPALAGATDLTANTVSTLVLKRLRGKARWNASHTLQQHVLAVAQEANAVKALGLLSARYQITHERVVADSFSREIEALIKTGMAEVQKTKSLRIRGSRTVTLEETTTLKVVPKISAIVKASGAGALNIGMLWFNIISLRTAYEALKADDAIEYSSGFVSSIFAVSASVGATLSSSHATARIIQSRYTSGLPQGVFGKNVLGLLATNGFSRWLGYPAIFSGLFSDLSKAYRQSKHGDHVSALYTASGGLAMFIGSSLVLEGGLAILGPTFFIPVAGWIAATVVLAGMAVVAGGLYLFSQAAARKHTPLELWVARSIFGNRLNDGEVRHHLTLDHESKLPAYPGLSEELQAWHVAYHEPLLLERITLKGASPRELRSAWHYAPPVSPLARDLALYGEPSLAEFTVLLKNFVIGNSTWTAHFMGYSAKAERETVNTYSVTCFEIPTALILNFKCPVNKFHKIALSITYLPYSAFGESDPVYATFYLEI